MNTLDVLNHYGTQAAVADALGIAQASISKWAKRDSVPQLRQLQLEALTGGALKAEKNILPRKKSQRQGLNNSFDSAKVKSIAGHA